MTPEKQMIVIIRALIMKRAEEIGYEKYSIPSKRDVTDEVLIWLLQFYEEICDKNNI